MSGRRWLVPLFLGAGLLAVACHGSPPGEPGNGTPAFHETAWRKDLQTWVRQRIARLTAPDGWLSLVGLSWLPPGKEVPFGSDPSLPVALPPGSAPLRAGTLRLLEDGRVRLRAAEGVRVTVDGREVVAAVLDPATEGKKGLVRVGRVLLYAIRRGDRVGIRVKDPESPARKNFHGIDRWPPDPRWRIVARWEPFPSPREMRVRNAIGQEESVRVPGRVVFRVEGTPCELWPMVPDPPDSGPWFFVFADGTTGTETYGGGRFLEADPPRPDGTIVLDFNRAYTPPCAFTPFATCPLPPAENRLPVEVRAGERVTGHLHGSPSRAGVAGANSGDMLVR